MRARDRIIWFDYLLYRFLAKWGEVIVKNPNKIFYAVLLIACIFFPGLAVFFTLCLLCWAYKEYYGD